MFAKNGRKCLNCWRKCTELSSSLVNRPLVAGQHSFLQCKRGLNEMRRKLEEMKAKRIASLEEEYKESRHSVDRFNREFDELSVDKFDVLIKNENDRLKVRDILEVYEYEKYSSAFVPKTLTVEQMRRLMNESLVRRMKTLKYFYDKEVHEGMDDLKRQFNAKKVEEVNKIYESFGLTKSVGIEYDETGAPIYGLWKNSMFSYITKQQYTHRLPKLYDACLFGQPLVFDFGFESEMNEMCLTNTTKQMAMCVGDNRRSDRPFSLWFCNLKRDSNTESKLLNAIGNLYPDADMYTSFINVRQESYLDMFPKHKLVYLTPDADMTLDHFDHSAVYIVGAFVDKSQERHQKSSFCKAKRERLKMAKLPIDQYVHVKGHKTLTMDQMVKILVAVKDTNSWKEAFKHIPSRKLKTEEEIAAEEQRRLSNSKFKRKVLSLRLR